MKKGIAIVLALACILSLAACGSKASAEIEIDYGTSSAFSREDMDAAIEVILGQFNTWEGCEMHSISYASDAECNEENVAWMNELEAANDAKETFTQCIMFTSSFHSPKDAVGAWEPDHEYTDWQWWLARSEGGQWKLLTWGY